MLLGALFAPCMRRDRQLFEGIDEDRARERDLSGCCVRRDGSGCFQAEQQAECQVSSCQCNGALVAHMDNKRIKLINNCKPNHSLISSLAWGGLIIIYGTCDSTLRR